MDDQFLHGYLAGAFTALIAALGAMWGVHLDRMASKKKKRHEKQRLQYDPTRTFIKR